MGGKGAPWLSGQGRGQRCLESAEAEKQSHPAQGTESEAENAATESASQGQRQGPWHSRAQQRRPGWGDQARVGVKGRPVCPPDRAEKRVHLEALPRLGPQQEHILWETEGRCQCPHSLALGPPLSRPRACPLTQLVKVGLGTPRAGHRADQPGLEKGAPFVHQHALAAGVILRGGGQSRPSAPRTGPPPAPPPPLCGGEACT